MDRSKLTAIITGGISLILAIAYLMLVQLLDLRGEMIPAPINDLSFKDIEPIATITNPEIIAHHPAWIAASRFATPPIAPITPITTAL